MPTSSVEDKIVSNQEFELNLHQAKNIQNPSKDNLNVKNPQQLEDSPRDNTHTSSFSLMTWFRESREKKVRNNANESYKTMSEGLHWLGHFKDLTSFEDLVKNNIQQIRAQTNPLTEDAHHFVEKFQQLRFDLHHRSKMDFMGSNKVTFRSRDELIAKKMLSIADTNTTAMDFLLLKTKGFAFFSLSVQNIIGKISSEFGDILYQTPLDSIMDYKYTQYSHVAINDTINFHHRQARPSRLADQFNDRDDVLQLKNEYIASSASETVYSYRDFKEALALHIVKSTMPLSAEAQQMVFNTEGPGEFDRLISLFFRPQFLVPKKLESTTTKMIDIKSLRKRGD